MNLLVGMSQAIKNIQRMTNARTIRRILIGTKDLSTQTVLIMPTDIILLLRKMNSNTSLMQTKCVPKKHLHLKTHPKECMYNISASIQSVNTSLPLHVAFISESQVVELASPSSMLLSLSQ